MIRRTRKRYEIAGHARYLTCSCYRRLPLFDDDRLKREFAEQLMAERADHDISIVAWVVMPEHVHVLALPRPPEVTVTMLLSSLKRRSAAAALALMRGESSPWLDRLADSRGVARFWQKGGGYDRNIFSRQELIEKINYIHENPVRRGLVKYPTDWAWSSARAWAGLETDWPEYDPL